MIDKKIISLLIIVLLAFSLTGCKVNITRRGSEKTDVLSEDLIDAGSETESEETGLAGSEEEEKPEVYSYPTEIDFEQIYADSEAFYADYDKCVELIDGLEGKYRGKLNNAKTIDEYFGETINGEILRLVERLSLYATLRFDVDYSDAEATELYNITSYLKNYYYEKNAFAESEIVSLPLEKRQELFSDPLFDPYRTQIYRYYDPDTVSFSEHENEIISILTSSFERMHDLSCVVTDIDVGQAEHTFKDGTTKKIDNATYKELMGNPKYVDELVDLEDEINEAKRKPFAESEAFILQTHIMEEVSKAKINGFDSVLNKRLHEDMVEPEIYDNITESVKNMLDDYHRYYRILKKALGIKGEMTNFQSCLPSVEYDSEGSFDETVGIIENSLSILGEDYIGEFDTLLRKGCVDAYPRDNKATYAFSVSCCDPSLTPYVMVNYYGDINDCSEIAHEMGHAMYNHLSVINENIPYSVKGPTNFTDEVASTLNEYLMYDYMIKTAKDKKERQYFLERQLDMINSYVVLQMMYSEFEDFCYKEVEKGESLSAEKLSDKWLELSKEYDGESIYIPDSDRYRWTKISHFFDTYYVYSYATSTTYSGIVANRILSGDEETRNKYLEMLKMGSSEKPSDLLRTVGLDPLDKDVYAEFAKYYKTLVDEYEEVVNSQ